MNARAAYCVLCGGREAGDTCLCMLVDWRVGRLAAEASASAWDYLLAGEDESAVWAANCALHLLLGCRQGVCTGWMAGNGDGCHAPGVELSMVQLTAVGWVDNVEMIREAQDGRG